MEELLKLIGHLAWPIVIAAFGYAFREELREIALGVAKRMHDPSQVISAGSFSMGPSKSISSTVATSPESKQLTAELKKDNALRGRLEDWMKSKGLTDVSTTMFLRGDEYQSLRESAVKDLLGSRNTESH